MINTMKIKWGSSTNCCKGNGQVLNLKGWTILKFLRGEGEGFFFVQHFFSHWTAFLLSVKTVQEIFFLKSSTPPSIVKWSAANGFENL